MRPKAPLTQDSVTTPQILSPANATPDGRFLYPPTAVSVAVDNVTIAQDSLTREIGVIDGSIGATQLDNVGTAGTYDYPASIEVDANGRTVAVIGGTAPLTALPTPDLQSLAYWSSPTQLASTGIYYDTSGHYALGTAPIGSCWYIPTANDEVAIHGKITNSTATSVAILAEHAGWGPAIKAIATNKGLGVHVIQSASGAGAGGGVLIEVTDSTNASAAFAITQDGSGPAISVTSSGPGVGLAISNSHGAGASDGITVGLTNSANPGNVASFGTFGSGMVIVASTLGSGTVISASGSSGVGVDVTTSTGKGVQISTTTGTGIDASNTTGIVVYAHANSSSRTNPIVSVLQDHASSNARGVSVKVDGGGEGVYSEVATGSAFYGYANTSSNAAPVGYLWQDNPSSAAPGLEIRQDGTGDALRVLAGGPGLSLYVTRTGTGSSDPVAYIQEADAGSANPVLRLETAGGGPTLDSIGYVQTEAINISDFASVGAFLMCTNATTGANVWAEVPMRDIECLTTTWEADTGGITTPGSIIFPASNGAFLVNFDVMVTCNDQVVGYESGVSTWSLTPYKGFDATITNGAWHITCGVEGNLPAGGGAWTTANISLWVYKNGNPFRRIDRRRFLTGETEFFVAGSCNVPCDGVSDYIEIFISQNTIATPTINNWRGWVDATFTHMLDCAACEL